MLSHVDAQRAADVEDAIGDVLQERLLAKIGGFVPQYSRLAQSSSTTIGKVRATVDNILTTPSKKAKKAELEAKAKAQKANDVPTSSETKESRSTNAKQSNSTLESY